MRTALLAAVGHDLRTPLASAKAAVTSLRSADIEWSAQDQAELLLTADESLDRLARLVDNLLDMSRLQAGALSVVQSPVALDEVVPLALDDLGPAGARRRGRRARRPAAGAGRPRPARARRRQPGRQRPALQPAGDPPLVIGSSLGDRVELRVIDRGPGIPPGRRGPGLRPVPAPRRHRQHHRRRARPRPVPRADRGDGRRR